MRDPSGAAVVDGDRRLDNTGLAAAVAELGDAFAAAGVGPGDTVAVMLPNRLEIVVAMFAAWSRGAALTPVNPALTDAEVGHQLDDSGAVLLVADDRGHEVARGRAVAVVHVDDLRGTSGAAPSTTPTVDPGAPALVVYTSGTTGRPKGCVLTHANVDAMVRAIVTHLRLDAADRSLLVLPLFHCNGLLVGVLAPLLAGGSVVVAPRFRPADFWDLVEAERPTYFSAVPTMYALIDAHTERAVDTSSLRFVVCGAAPMPADLIGRFEERFDVVLVEGYGLSECSVAATINPLDERRKPGTVGLPLPGIDVAIASADGEHLPAGERGEVLVRGATVMAGYLHRPEETAATVVDGWLHTGDVGYLDADGFLVLVDRVKDMVIRGGENIYPKEIEDVLYEHPAVLEAAVVGRPDPTYGEVPVAHVALRPGASATPDELRAHCAAVLARFKVPADVQLHAALPKNSVGKLLKPALRG
nr:AMP-binding protein [Nocardioides zeae]